MAVVLLRRRIAEAAVVAASCIPSALHSSYSSGLRALGIGMKGFGTMISEDVYGQQFFSPSAAVSNEAQQPLDAQPSLLNASSGFMLDSYNLEHLWQSPDASTSQPGSLFSSGHAWQPSATPTSAAAAAAAAAAPLLAPKSAKRRAAEALLAARLGGIAPASHGIHTAASSQQHQHQHHPQQQEQQQQQQGTCQHPPEQHRHHHTLQTCHHKRARNGDADVAQGSAKRFCATASTPAAAPAAAAASAAQKGVQVAKCEPVCSCTQDPSWCSFDVSLPNVNWQHVFEESPTRYSAQLLSKGYEKIVIGQGLQVYMVENAHKGLHEAMAALKASMRDQVVAIDLEWRPEYKPGEFHKVALLQLSSSTVCVLIRTSAMQYTLPPLVREFLADPANVIVGFAWDTADENKMKKSFGFGRADFGRFVDLSAVARDMGYGGFGLARLTKAVMGFSLEKNKKISRSNWASHSLSLQQVKYAALDVFATGQLFRGLRLWHSSPSECPGCQVPLGARLPPEQRTITCAACGPKQPKDAPAEPAAADAAKPAPKPRTFDSLASYHNHCDVAGHPREYAACTVCSRPYRLPKEGTQ